MWRKALLLLGLFIFAIAVAAQEEIAYGDEIEAEISGRIGDDYVFEGTEGDIVLIKMFSDEFDTVLTLFDSENSELATNDDAVELNSMLAFILPADGSYNIVADALDDVERGSSYTLSLELLEEESILEYGAEISGRVSDDWGEVWLFVAGEGDIVSVAMNSDIIDTYLEVFSHEGSLASNDDSGGTWDSQIANIEIPDDGVYFIVARSFAGGSNGAYNLSLEGASGELSELSGNNRGAIAFDTVIAGEIEDANGEVWTFEGQEDSWILIAMSSPSTDCYLDLFDPEGELLVRDDDSGIGYNAAILIELPDDGEYTLVTRAYGGRLGSYELSVSIIEDLDELVYITVNSSNNVNLRDEANEGGDIVDSAPAGDLILLVGRSEDNAWLQVVSLVDDPLWIAERITETDDFYGTSDDIDDLPVTD
jgi:hypothetical protein